MYRKLLTVSAVLLFTVGVSIWGQEQKSPADYVNPFIGAITASENSTFGGHGLGKTFPGAATPFGLVQLSPDTITGGDNGSGYSWHHKTIEGFSFTHMSGVGWYGDLGNLQTMATTGDIETDRIKYCSEFSHDRESASAGYYSVMLDRYRIKAELAAAPRSGIIRFTFPENSQSNIQLDLSRRVGGRSSEQFYNIIDDSTVEGWMHCPYSGGGWGHGAGKVSYKVHFRMEFSRPF